ncbi:MAG: hypothetical protein MJZ37_01230 [Bacilli bacterium]|nr:hypothetical protein [Bacilli bacterium]
MTNEEILKLHEKEIDEKTKELFDQIDSMGDLSNEGIKVENVDNRSVSEKVFDIYNDMKNKRND